MNVPISIFHSQSRLHPFSGRKVRQAAFRLLESYNIYLYYRNEEEAVICHNILFLFPTGCLGHQRNTRYNGEVYLLIRCKCFSRRFLYVISLTGFRFACLYKYEVPTHLLWLPAAKLFSAGAIFNEVMCLYFIIQWIIEQNGTGRCKLGMLFQFLKQSSGLRY